MALALLAVGVFGCLGLTVLCPLLALPGYYFRFWNPKTLSPLLETAPSHPSSIEIIVPARNEAGFIGGTLASIQDAIRHLEEKKSVLPLPKIGIRVGANNCTDATAEIARQFRMVSVTETSEKQGKWLTIKSLLKDSSAEWLILVDAGTLWPTDFLITFMERISREHHAIAAAPSYQPIEVGWISRAVWKIETALKKLESFCGGPVSLHGATVAYKSGPLKNALAYLGDRLWLNDDVVIPFVLRSLYREGVILYPVGQVQDAGIRQDSMDFGRRKRMLRGNIQWIKALWPDGFRLNPVAGIVAGRRFFRIFWAYWLGSLILGAVLAVHILTLPMVAIPVVLALMSGGFRQLSGAALVSLFAPLPMILPAELFGAQRWK